MLDVLRQKSYSCPERWEVNIKDPLGGEFEDMTWEKQSDIVEDLFTIGDWWLDSEVVRYILRDIEIIPCGRHSRPPMRMYPGLSRV